MAKTPEEMTAAMIENLKEKTGKTLAEWLKVAKAGKAAKHGELVKLLKSEHGVTHGYANLIALEALRPEGRAPAGGDELVQAQYAGAKATLRPIYDALIAAVKAFGTDVDVAPKKTYVSLRRSKQFALVQPSTTTRLDVGINLKGTPAGGRLEASGSFNAMVSHRVRVGDLTQVDAELLGWLRQAYVAS